MPWLSAYSKASCHISDLVKGKPTLAMVVINSVNSDSAAAGNAVGLPDACSCPDTLPTTLFLNVLCGTSHARAKPHSDSRGVVSPDC